MSAYLENDFDTIKHYLSVDREIFDKEIKEKAFKVLKEDNDSQVYSEGLLAITNVCVNNCHYCGLNRENGEIKRFTLDDDSIINSIKVVKQMGLKSLLLIGGENPKITIDHYLKYIDAAKKENIKLNLAMGVFNKKEYQILKDAGLDFYTLKFEVSNPKVFNSCNPDIDYYDRLKSIRDVKSVGLNLGTGSIVGLKNQSLDDLVNDIMLTKELEANWVPIVPYLPAKNSIMAKDTPFGNVDLLLRSIAILRLLLPKAQITAGQPTQNSKLGFADPVGNINALEHGANKLFVELTPYALRGEFEIVEGRKLLQLEKIDNMVNKLTLKRI